MATTTPKTKCRLFGLLLALVVAGTPLVSAQEAKAQVQPPLPTMEKTVAPNPVGVGQPLTFTIDVVAASGTSAEVGGFTDDVPAGATPTGATLQPVLNGVPTGAPIPCTVSGNTVSCPQFNLLNDPGPPPVNSSVRITIDAIAQQQCGTFTNSAFAEARSDEFPPTVPPNFNTGLIEDTADFTVVGCEGAAPGATPGAAVGGGPVTQESEQESESGDIDQSFEITSEGDNSNQCAGVQGVANTGNPQNGIDLLQYASKADEFEFEEVGSDITVSPESASTCDQQVNQAASASD